MTLTQQIRTIANEAGLSREQRRQVEEAAERLVEEAR